MFGIEKINGIQTLRVLQEVRNIGDYGEKILKKFVYTSEWDDDIISHENKMLKLYKEKIEKNYLHVFEEKGFGVM